MRFSTICTLMFLGVAATAGHSQTGSGTAVQPAAKPEDLCTMDGRVLDAVSGDPIKKASVTLTPQNSKPVASATGMTLPQQFSTSTDASGRFAMKDLDPGQYRLQVARNGYVAGEYGARGPSKTGTVLTLTRGQQTKDLVVKLTPHGVIAGRVLDEDGDPVASMMVQLLKPSYSGGKKQLSTAGSGQTNDLGEYRIFGLPPGKYYVTAGSLTITPSLSVDRSATPRPEEDYVATYYPGVTDPASAAAVDVAAGVTTHGIDLSIAKRRTVHITGRVNAPSKVPMLYLTPRSMAGALSLRIVRVDANGEFEARGLAPGSYALTGSAQQNGKTFSASLPIEVGQDHIEGLVFTIGPGVAVTGRLRVDGENTVDLSKVKVALQPHEMGLGSLMGAIGSILSGGGIGADAPKLGEDLSFKLDDISSDTYDVTVTGLPDGFFVESELSGQADVLLSGLEVKGATPEPLEILLSPHGAQIDGTVHTASHQLPSQGTVALLPREKERAGRKAFCFETTVGPDGGFHIKNVPPGEYRLFAWEDVESGAWMDPDFMKPLDDRGNSITVHADGHETADLTLIPADAGVK
jgi:protocatechuate 3,4-dioxygenase beta subunit